MQIGARQSQAKWGVPASVTIAQAVLESAWGNSALAKQCCNFFGIKARAGDEYKEFTTDEFIDGRDKKVLAKFAKYPSPIESFDAHGKLLATIERYQPCMEVVDDPLDFALKLQLCGYSTDAGYASKLAGLIKVYKLTQYDLPLAAAAAAADAAAQPVQAKTTTEAI